MESIGEKELDPIDNVKNTIRIIEGLFHAINQASFPIRIHDLVMDGMRFLDSMHTGLVKQLPPEEIEKIKQQQKQEVTGAVA